MRPAGPRHPSIRSWPKPTGARTPAGRRPLPGCPPAPDCTSGPPVPVGHRTRAVGHRTRPVAHRTGPVAHRTRPVAHRTGPVAHRTRPVAHRTGPVAHRTRPVAHRTGPVGHRTRPVAHRTGPVGHRTRPVAHRTLATDRSQAVGGPNRAVNCQRSTNCQSSDAARRHRRLSPGRPPGHDLRQSSDLGQLTAPEGRPTAKGHPTATVRSAGTAPRSFDARVPASDAP
jgi:hypothetical protein